MFTGKGMGIRSLKVGNPIMNKFLWSISWRFNKNKINCFYYIIVNIKTTVFLRIIFTFKISHTIELTPKKVIKFDKNPVISKIFLKCS